MIEDGIRFQSQNHHHTNTAYIYEAYYNGTPGSGLNSLENREINNPRTQGFLIVVNPHLVSFLAIELIFPPTSSFKYSAR